MPVVVIVRLLQHFPISPMLDRASPRNILCRSYFRNSLCFTGRSTEAMAWGVQFCSSGSRDDSCITLYKCNEISCSCRHTCLIFFPSITQNPNISHSIAMTVESTAAVSFCNKEIGSLPAPYPEVAENILDAFKLTKKSGVVTGGARGIGFVVSEAYAQAGIENLAIVDYAPNDAAIESLKEKYPKTKFTFHACDVRKAEQVEAVIKAIHEEFKQIDIFVANAGIAWTSGALIEQPNDNDWHNVLNVDLNGVYYCAKHVGRIFKEQGFGSLVMTASMSAHIVNVPQLQAAYNVAKAGVLHLGKSLAVEWAPFARVNTVSPGYIATELSDFVPVEQKNIWYAMTPQGRQGAPKELAGAYLFLASDAATYVTGADLKVDGGYCCK